MLIVEDDAGVSHLQSVRLQRFGHVPTVVATAEEALAACEKGDYDLVILDYSLSGDVNGLDLFMILQTRGYTLPAILVTGFEDPRIILQAMRVGVRDFLPKTTEYLEELPLTVERVLRQVSLERRAAESASILEKQELLEAAFEAARLASCRWDIENGGTKWFGQVDLLFGPSRVAGLKTFDQFIDIVHSDDQAHLREDVQRALELKEPFESQFRVIREDGALCWLSARGRYYFDRDGSAVRLTVVLSDETRRKESENELARSHAHIKALNDRLQLSLVETHHRTKNSLQNIISLLNLQFRKQGGITEEEVHKLTSHIQGLAAVHDVLSDQALDEGETRAMDLEEVFDRVLAVLTRGAAQRPFERELEPCQVTSRQAASLTVILNELVSNGLKHGTGALRVELHNRGTTGELRVINEGSQFPPGFDVAATTRTGLILVRTLARADLNCEPKFENLDDRHACVLLTFKLTDSQS